MGRLAFATWSVAMSGLLFACEMAEPPENPPAGLQPGAALGLGATGEDVRAVNEYLRQHGYFPNDEVGRRYPSWRPIVSQGPARTNVYDEQTQAAVRALQANMGLPVTGIVDAATKATLAQGRCGVPDGIHSQEARFKFSKQGSKWPTTNVTWRVNTINTAIETDVTTAQAQTAAAAAFAAWAAETTLTFTQVPSGEDITITFNTLPNGMGVANGPGGTLARNKYPEFGGDMEIDVAETWSVANPPPAGAHSLTDVMTHEIGHGLGLHHSGHGNTVVMHPAIAPGTATRPLHVDDRVGISSIYDTWFNLPGAGKDIAVGADGSAWVIGLGPVVGGNFAIHKWNEGTFSWQASDGGAVRIAVSQTGVPWVVNAAGQIFRRTSSSPTSGFWELMPGGARDIGIGADGSVWVIGTAAIPGGFEIFKFNGSGWDKSNGGAVKIAVDSAGVPWVTASDGRIFRRDSNSASSGNWELMPGGGNDIGVGPANYPFLIGAGAIPGGFEIWLWDQQPQAGTDGHGPARREWVKLPGGAVTVSVGPNARPWVINSSGQIFRSFL
jgi:peptidoglycan hydrolase-like protein with peptidoglycan-binding domain